MPFKYDAAGNIVIIDHEGKKLPVFVSGDGKEMPFDADVSVGKISALNGESRDWRVRAEKAETAVKALEGIDPAKAREALDVVSKLDQKKLVDAGEIDKVRAEIKAGYEGQIAERDKKLADANGRLTEMQRASAFAGSKFVASKVAIPIEFLRARFEPNFQFDESGKMFAVDAAGNKIYSKNPQRMGELADFDEALEHLVSSHSQRDSILKGTNASGGGAHQNGNAAAGGGNGGKRTMLRRDFDAITDPALKMKTAQEAVIVDS